MNEQTVFAHGDFQAPCLVRRTGAHEVEVTLTAVRAPDVAALMRAMKTVCGSRECRLITATSTTQMMCHRVEGRERIHTLTGGVAFVLGLRALPRLDVAVCGETCGTLTCTEPKGHAGQHRDGRQCDWHWSPADCDRKPAAPPAPQPCDGCAAPPEGKGFAEWRHADNCPARDVVAVTSCEHCGAECKTWRAGCATEAAHDAACPVAVRRARRDREAPLVALVAAVPEGLDPIGWKAAVLAVDERRSRGATTIPQESWEAFARDILRGAKPNEEPVGWPDVAVAAYRRALTRQPPPVRPGRVLACNAYDVPGQP